MAMILGIDPGNEETGWCVIDADTRTPVKFEKEANYSLRAGMATGRFEYVDAAAIEMIASYGMPVGAEVFDTCVWIGRFIEVLPVEEVDLIKRLDVKRHICHSASATDATIRQALVDRFAYGQRNHGKGTKAEPGWFYGFHSDIWSAYALAVVMADNRAGDV